MGENSDKTYSLNDYQADAMSVRLESANDKYAVLGMVSEAGEVADLFAKAIRDGKKFDFEQNVKKELGDVLWGIAAIAMDNGFTLEDVARTNINKLFSRRDRGVLTGSGDNR